jgi:KDO2-lipid IV(A) lauroyltransferase
LWLLYFVSDLLFFPTYYLARYRRKIVRRNLTGSFPEKDLKEIVRIEKRFYHFFCDYIVETIKLFSMSEEQMKRRMVFKGVDHIVSAMEKEDKNFCFVYLGHYCNWEWIASLPYWCPDDVKCGQIYHPLYNKAFDRLFLRLRNQFGGECIAMKETLRRIIEMKRAKQKCIIGFISDQAPKWNSIHHWCDFLHRETPVFIGTERIGKQVDALIYYADVKRTRRGYYLCEFKPLTHRPKEVPDYELTDRFTHLLEEMIKERPDFWLWSHKRWKRTKEEWIRRQQEEEKK